MPGLDFHCGVLDPGLAAPELAAFAAEYAARERAELARATEAYDRTPSITSAAAWLATAEHKACTVEALEAALAAVEVQARGGDPVEGARALIEAGRVVRLARGDEARSVAIFRASLDRAPLPEVLPWLVRGARRLGEHAVAQEACQRVWDAAAADTRYAALDACVRPYDGRLDEALAWAPRSVRRAFVRERIAALAPSGEGQGPARVVKVVGACSEPKRLGIGRQAGRRTRVLRDGESATIRVREGEPIWLFTPSGYAEAARPLGDEAEIRLRCGGF